MPNGLVCELWRYPVSSLGGECVQTLSSGETGIDGDRRYVLVDLRTGVAAAPEKAALWRPAMMMSARYEGDSVMVSLPNGPELPADDPHLDRVLSDHMGFACGIRKVGSVIRTQHDLIQVRPRYQASPLHILTTATLARLKSVLPEGEIDRRRFRPTVVVETDALCNEWIGRSIAIGSVKGMVTEPTKRCGMTMIQQPGLVEDPEILRTIVRKFARSLGVYADVAVVGSLNIKDDVAVS